jgi:hypothetical protein
MKIRDIDQWQRAVVAGTIEVATARIGLDGSRSWHCSSFQQLCGRSDYGLLGR